MSEIPTPVRRLDKTDLCEHHFEYKGDVDLSKLKPGWGDGYQSEKDMREKYQCPICKKIEYREKEADHST